MPYTCCLFAPSGHNPERGQEVCQSHRPSLSLSPSTPSPPQVSLIVGKKRNIAAEKRQKKEQKDEAERHMEKMEQLVSE